MYTTKNLASPRVYLSSLDSDYVHGTMRHDGATLCIHTQDGDYQPGTHSMLTIFKRHCLQGDCVLDVSYSDNNSVDNGTTMLKNMRNRLQRTHVL